MKSWSNWWLAGSALAGAALATAGIVRTPAPVLADDAVATVNGAPIRRADYQTALAAVAADSKRHELDPALRRHVLERLIDEEILVQAALELGLAQRDRRVRADLSSATLAFLKEAPAREPSEAELRELFEALPGFFAAGARFALEQRYFAGSDAAARGRALAARAAWQKGEVVSGDPAPLSLPQDPLPLGKLEQYLGPAAARAVAELPAGGVSEPLARADGFVLLRTKSRAGGSPRFEDVRDAVRAEWRRRNSEAELRRFLSDRRARARVTVSSELGS